VGVAGSIKKMDTSSIHKMDTSSVKKINISKKATTIDYRNTEINLSGRKKSGIPPLGAAKFHFSQSSMAKNRLFNLESTITKP
jgi:hypothetical protein